MRLVLAATLVAALCLPAAAAGADGTLPPMLVDPHVPDAVAKKAARVQPKEPSRGAALDAEVERKLRAAFDAADDEGRGSVTLPQARAAGLGLVVREFERIDLARTGRVSFEDLARYLRSQGARI
jgi:hypothetical protein